MTCALGNTIRVSSHSAQTPRSLPDIFSPWIYTLQLTSIVDGYTLNALLSSFVKSRGIERRCNSVDTPVNLIWDLNRRVTHWHGPISLGRLDDYTPYAPARFCWTSTTHSRDERSLLQKAFSFQGIWPISPSLQFFSYNPMYSTSPSCTEMPSYPMDHAVYLSHVLDSLL